MSVSDIDTYVTLTGRVVYQSGIDLTPSASIPTLFDGYTVRDTLPVKGMSVDARVDWGMYQDGTTTGRYVNFTGYTDNNGNFSIQVPVPVTSTGFNIVDLTLHPFTLKNYEMVENYFVSGYGYFYRVVNKNVYFNGKLSGLSLPSGITISTNQSYMPQYNLGVVLIKNPSVSTSGTHFDVLP